MTSPARVKYHLEKLRKMFARADDHAFLQLVWATDALQSDRVDSARPFIAFPPQAANASIASPFAIHRWELETLLVQLFLTPKQEIHPGPNLILNCGLFDSMRETINRLRKLEDIESAVYLASENFSIFDEMHRIAQRQFHWQRGYLNLPQMYRYAYLYGQGQCGEYFRAVHGFPIGEFNLAAFALFATYQRIPWQNRTYTAPQLGLTREIRDKVLPLLTLSAARARCETESIVQRATAAHGKPLPTAYLPSIFRQYPLVATDEHQNVFISPIPELILLRVTAGLYYDVIGGGQALLNEANDRFEQYCVDYFEAMMPRFSASRSFKYGQRGAQIDTPDVLITDNDKVVLVAECKATKLTYLAQFAEDPFDAQKRQYDQLANGVVQLWRYFSHVRRGILDQDLSPNVEGMVITLDTYFQMSRPLRGKVIEQANALADMEDGITPADRRPVIFCPIQDIETILSRGTEDTFLASMKAAQEERYQGWHLREVHRDLTGDQEPENKRFPFALDVVLPWWKRAAEAANAAMNPR